MAERLPEEPVLHNESDEEEYHLAVEPLLPMDAAGAAGDNNPQAHAAEGEDEFGANQLGQDLEDEPDDDDDMLEDDNYNFVDGGDNGEEADEAAAVVRGPHLLNRLLGRLWPRGDADAEADAAAAAVADAPDQVNFNRDLPGEHAYLGSDLESPAASGTGRTVLADGAILELPTLTCSLGVLLPGQLLPVALFHPSDVALVAGMGAGRVGPVAVLRNYRYGSTAELLSCKEESDDNVGITMVRAKLIGRQRFEALSLRRDISGRIWARIRTLPEPKQLSPFPSRPGPRRTLQLAGCPFPAWVADCYNSRRLVAAIRSEMAAWNRSWVAVQAGPEDPAAFAYWLLEQLPLPDWLRADLLGCPHPVGCLRRCLALLRRCSALRCARCLGRIADKSAIFCLAAGGSTGAYVNPGGHVHEMMTVAAAEGLRRVGRPCPEHSWFPGYAWQILECSGCSQHMGWRFTAQTQDARPAAFYGLCRASLQPDLTPPRDADAADDWSGELPESVVTARVSLKPLLRNLRGDSGGGFGDSD